jgi:hypothetical protein
MKRKLAAALATLLLVGCAEAQVLPNDAVVDGKTIGDWSAEWWKWILPISVSENPAFDEDGSLANVAQPDGPVFLLAKGFNANRMGHRTFTVPEGKYLFMPLIAFYVDNIDTEPPWSVDQLRDFAKASIDLVTGLHATIDGVLVPDLFSYRAISPVFSIYFESGDNLSSLSAGRPILGWNDPIVADGYYVMVPPLSPGTHVINFGATVGPPVNLMFDMTDTITVIPIPLAQRVNTLIIAVGESSLAAHRQQPLLATLRAAGASFGSGNSAAGINQLRAFQNKVGGQLARREGLATQLTEAAQNVIDKAIAQSN